MQIFLFDRTLAQPSYPRSQRLFAAHREASIVPPASKFHTPCFPPKEPVIFTPYRVPSACYEHQP